MSSGQLEMSPLAPDLFREVIGHFATGVTVITALHEDRRYGTTASAVSSVSLEPPMLLICMNQNSSTGQAVAASKHFTVNILAEDQPDLAVHFASKGSDKFATVAYTTGRRGDPLINDALATLECRVTESPTGGTHTVFLAEVDRVSARRGSPLAYFRGQFGRLQLNGEETQYSVESALAARQTILLGVVQHAVGRVEAAALDELRQLVAVLPLTGPAAEWRRHLAQFERDLIGLTRSDALSDDFARADVVASIATGGETDLGSEERRRLVANYHAVLDAIEAADTGAANAAIERITAQARESARPRSPG
jgi:flavin reductase (DIM6/NTAB) family NADH-FMN oxidoreductase RutF